MILLDTDIMIDVLRQYPPALEWLKTLSDEEMILSGFVVMELILGLLDAFIGQMAVTLNLPLHTFNQKHYVVIPRLKTIQPYDKNTQRH